MKGQVGTVERVDLTHLLNVIDFSDLSFILSLFTMTNGVSK